MANQVFDPSRIPLTWEASDPTRSIWSDFVIGKIGELWHQYAMATDAKIFRLDWDMLNKSQKINSLAELISSTSYYESSWNPESWSIDVGQKGNIDTYSVGLMQVSVIDQDSYQFDLGYTFEDLKDPIKNLNLALLIMGKQIERHGLIAIPKGHPGLYWAVLSPGGKYDKTTQIANRVRKMKHAISPEIDHSSFMANSTGLPWRDWFIQRIGWTEFDHDTELSKGWPLTNACKDYKTVIGVDHAWCGMSLASALNSGGYRYPKACEAAASYDDYGTEIDFRTNGIPLGAIVTIEHYNGGRHVTTANRYHSPGEKVLSGLGGNQDDAIDVKSFFLDTKVKGHDRIVSVRWPVT